MKKIERDPSFGRSCIAMSFLPKFTLAMLTVALFMLQASAGDIHRKLGFDPENGKKTGTEFFEVIVTGKIVDDNGAPLSGVSISEKGTNNATSSKPDGSFSITVTSEKSRLVITHIGYGELEVAITSSHTLLVRLLATTQTMDSVIVVGYGRQRKQSVVGAISQTTGKVLQRAGGVSTIGGALTGNVPGVITVTGVGTPGAEDPTIYIRGQSTWNNSNPLVLVDGIERSITGVDIGSVESISVLKDASATAIFGVKGANGVILITTKRGTEGKANINIIANSTVKYLHVFLKNMILTMP